MSQREIEKQFADRDITNSISTLGKLFKNEIQQPNNYKKVIRPVCKLNLQTDMYSIQGKTGPDREKG